MSPAVEKEYKDALRRLLSRAVPLVSPERRNAFSRADYHKAQHVVLTDECSWVIPPGLTVSEESHYEFAGTEASDNLVTTIVAEGVSCACGRLTNETIEIEATFAEVLAQVADINHRTETL